MNSNLNKRSKETLISLIDILKEKHRCALLRPTGFGKTYLLAELIAKYKYKRVVYIYPSDAVKSTLERYLTKYDNITVSNINDGLSLHAEREVMEISYRYLAVNNNNVESIAYMILNYFDLIIFDEMHHMGAEKSGDTISQLLNYIENSDKVIDVIGATATPARMDGFNIVDEFFNNSIVPLYSLDEAIDDELVKEPYYVYASFNATKLKKDYGLHKIEIKSDSDIKLVKELEKITNASNIIKETIDKNYEQEPSYMKFMVFLSRIDIAKEQTETIKGWFKEAFPNKKVRHLVVDSSSENMPNIDKLSEIKKVDNTVDVIISVNMLNEGYHVDDVTAVIMLRPTKSSIVYTQQVGRCISVGSTLRPIIIDFVDNFTTKQLFGMDEIECLNDKSTDLNKQLAKMNTISVDRIELVDYRAKYEGVVKKIKESSTAGLDVSVVKYLRLEASMAIDLINKKTNIGHEKILRLLIDAKLPLYNLDKFIWDNGKPTNKLIDNFELGIRYIESNKIG